MGATKSDHQAGGKSKILRVAEIEQLCPDEWVLLEITRNAKDALRVAGRLLAHSPNRDDLDEPYERLRADHPEGRVYEFFTGGEKIPEDVVVIL
jgi:hypothetical protein